MQIKEIEETGKKMKVDDKRKLVVFGAGERARHIIAQMLLQNIKIDGVMVSNTKDNPIMLLDIPVQGIESYVRYARKTEVVLGVSNKFKTEVIELLTEKGFVNVSEPEIMPLYYSMFEHVDECKFVEMWYFARTGKKLDWKNLTTYNEKIQWLKLYDNIEKKRILTDKYLVRNYVKNKIGESYLIPLLGVWNRFEDIVFDELPDSFVLKCNHGSGWNYIVRNKNEIDISYLSEVFDEWISTDYSDIEGLELQYRGIYPQIIAEKYLSPQNGVDLDDYKLFVFDGEVKVIELDMNRSINHQRNIYSVDWELLPYQISYENIKADKINKPKQLEEMIQIARCLSEGFKHVRVDLYIWNEKVYFGELTFSHGGGIEYFDDEEFANRMGEWIKL